MDVEDGVFALITDLCNRTASKYADRSNVPQTQLVSKMRSHAYEILLKKSPEVHYTRGEPVIELLSYYFNSQKNVKNVLDYKKSIELKRIISQIRQTDFGDDKDQIFKVLKLLVALSDSVQVDHSSELFQKPFSFGLLNEMLPRPTKQAFGSPEPYPNYPCHMFQLPFSLKKTDSPDVLSKAFGEYSVESFNSQSFLPNLTKGDQTEIKSYSSPKSMISMTSTQLSPTPYSPCHLWNFPRLSVPRDLQIPGSGNNVEPKVSFPASTSEEVREVYRAPRAASLDIWEIATQVDKDIPHDIWDIACRTQPDRTRRPLAASPREMALWRRTHDVLSLAVRPETALLRDLMYLTFGIATESFPFSEEHNCFYMRDNLALEGLSQNLLRGYVTDLLLVGTYYRRLFHFAFTPPAEGHFHTKGLVYEASREVVRRYLLEFRLKVTAVYESSSGTGPPTLLQVLSHVEPLKYEIETLASIYRLFEPDPKVTIPVGAELMSYLFNEISMVTHQQTARTLFNSLLTICGVYFKFIERFIFEGELEDPSGEFFIRKEAAHANARSKRYWDRGFWIANAPAVPPFLASLARYILLCGKSLRLLKHCNPSEPLVVLISSDHPSVACCSSFEELARFQRLLDVYRTRCLFVSGEPASFNQILLKKEAARKAFTEMASLKQAETLEKIVAERKRLAQLIVAEKQHSLRVLEQAMAEAQAARVRARQRDRRLCALERDAATAAHEVDSRIREDERNKMLEYYSKLNQEVEKSKLHTEWKMKRLQLNETRIQMLSTEERNLKREKLELEHKRNEDIMAMSIQSLESVTEGKSEDEIEKDTNEDQTPRTSSHEIETQPSEMEINRAKSKSSTDMISALFSAAKNIFGVKSENVDNKKDLDAQGNIVPVDAENNTVSKETCRREPTSSEVIGSELNEEYDNIQFLKMREEALMNKQKVMAHEYGRVDLDNNELDAPTAVSLEQNVEDATLPFAEAKRNKMKVLGAEFHLAPVIKLPTPTDSLTEAQKEALMNKQKVLGVEYNLPLEFASKKEPANVAQEEAIRNRDKVLGSDTVRPVASDTKSASHKRSNLTLNLKPYSSMSKETDDISPNIGAVTPRDFIPMLDLETPTTAEIQLEGAMTADEFTPHSEGNKLETGETASEKPFLTSSGFDFSILVDEMGDAEMETKSNPDTPLERHSPTHTRYSFINHFDGSYSLENFDPFGVKDLKKFSKNYFSSKMDLLSSSDTTFTHPSVIMEEVKKKPYHNMFSHLDPEYEEENKVECDNIATLTACLQRSIMLPLTYQLEVVNNSILKYFLVDLDMYEHLRSLKDYFFLIDGEFCKSISQNLFERLTKTINPQEMLNFATLHSILDKALGSSISHVNKFSENLSFTITETPLSFQHSSPDVLSCLSLTYAVEWPLNIVLSQEALLRYAKVFQFLLKMRRICWVLGQDFEYLKLSAKLSKQHSRKLSKSPHYISVQIYRHIMASLIRSLDNYIVTTCILTSWKEFENDLIKARTLDDLYDCHVVYIKKVLFRCLLNNRSAPVRKLLNDIFTVILKFSRVVRHGEWQQKEPNGFFTHSNFPQIKELFHLFEKLAKYLHKVISKLMEYGYQRHLVELLTMINLNGYYDYEKSKEDSNTSKQSV